MSKQMNVRRLMEMLSHASPEALVVVDGDDHNYYEAFPHEADAEWYEGELCETHINSYRPKMIPVVVFR